MTALVKKLGKAVRFFAFYVRTLCNSNIRVAKDVLTPGLNVSPAFLEIPVRAKTDAEILTLSNLITMTPGTLALDVSTDRKKLYVHVLYASSEDEVRRSVGGRLQERILEVFQ